MIAGPEILSAVASLMSSVSPLELFSINLNLPWCIEWFTLLSFREVVVLNEFLVNLKIV